MSRTYRAVPYKHYWGDTKEDLKRRIKDWEDGNPWGAKSSWAQSHIDNMKRDLLLHGTESRNYCYPTHEWFNFAHRVGRRVARDQLRPHIVLGENYDFDDSRYRRKYKGVWWDIY